MESGGAPQGVAPPKGWTEPGFDDSLWSASESPNPSSCGATWTPVESWERPAKPMWDVGDNYAAFFRKVLTVGDVSLLTEARITVFADDDVAVWVNGIELYVEADFGMSEDTGFDNTVVPKVLELAPVLVSGENTISIHGQYTAGGCRWALVSGSVSSG